MNLNKYLFGVLLGVFLFPIMVEASDRLLGSSIANARLQYDTLTPVYVNTVAKFNKKCKDFSVIDTKVTRKPTYKIEGEYAYADGPWNELWTTNYCGKSVLVPIKFIPNKETGGTMYVISSKRVKIKE